MPRTVTYCRAFLTVTLFGNGPVSTLVMVEKGGEGCMAADTLMSYGMRKQPARYVARPEKIIGVDGWYIGLFGRCAHQAVLESAFAHGLKLPETASEQDLFEFSRVLHRKLKKEGFLNPTENADDPYESSQMMSFLLTRNGMFGLYPLGSVERHRRFAAAGSGTDYALRAMYPAYRQDLAAEETARLCVEAGIEFDHASLGPITLMRIQLEREGVPARECESVAATA